MAHTLQCIVTPVPPSEDAHPFSARVKRGYLVRFLVVSVALIVCTAAVVNVVQQQRFVELARLQSLVFVFVCLVLVSLELQVDLTLAHYADYGLPRRLRIEAIG